MTTDESIEKMQGILSSVRKLPVLPEYVEALEDALFALFFKKAREISPVTNADKIRMMSDEDLAKWLHELSCVCECCTMGDSECDLEGSAGCELHILNWLRTPVLETET